MKTLLLLVLGAWASQGAASETLKTVTIKSSLELTDTADGFPGSAHYCYDLEQGHILPAPECRAHDVPSRRLCSLVVYNLASATPVSSVPAGTVFFVNRQLGPEIHRDWDKRISAFKIFSNRSGQSESLSNPNLIIQCYQTFDNYRTPSLFGLDEIAAAMASEVSLQ
ncbi:MAG: hypothetical protein IT288_10890 [Bdellovibrionales bacterium]|nr:hypothetical protein [Bdellovibrionales bacterium]